MVMILKMENDAFRELKVEKGRAVKWQQSDVVGCMQMLSLLFLLDSDEAVASDSRSAAYE